MEMDLSKVGRVIGRTARVLGNALDRGFAEKGYPTTKEQLLVLFALTHSDGMNQQELAHKIFLNKASITNLLDKLERDALVRREGDPRDRRNKRVVLTPAGRDRQAELALVIEQTLSGATRGIPPDELALALRVLDKIAANTSPDFEGTGCL